MDHGTLHHFTLMRSPKVLDTRQCVVQPYVGFSRAGHSSGTPKHGAWTVKR